MTKHKEDTKPVKMRLSQIQPYWRNPRNTSAAIEKVKQSIEAYGYANPIVVDKNNVIITGHSRYRALLKLDYDEVDVIVSNMSPKLAHEYRLIDNKTSEYATWTQELETELVDFDDTLKVSFFPSLGETADIRVIEGGDKSKDPTVEEDLDVELLCPYCIESFTKKQSELLGE